MAVRPPFDRLVRIDLATWGAGHVLPGGPAGTALVAGGWCVQHAHAGGPAELLWRA